MSVGQQMRRLLKWLASAGAAGPAGGVAWAIIAIIIALIAAVMVFVFRPKAAEAA